MAKLLGLLSPTDNRVGPWSRDPRTSGGGGGLVVSKVIQRLKGSGFDSCSLQIFFHEALKKYGGT